MSSTGATTPAPSAAAARLGQYLPCSSETIEAALRHQATSFGPSVHKRLGEVLVEGEVISTEDLLAGIRAQRMDRLRRCALFDGFAERDLRVLSDVFAEVTVESDDVFISQGGTERYLYVLACGELEVFRVDAWGEQLTLATVEEGEPVGELGFVTRGARTASVRAKGRCQLLRASFDALRAVMDAVPKLALAFLDVVARRLAHTTLQFEDRHHRVRDVERSLTELGHFLDPSGVEEVGTGIEGLIESLVHSASKIIDADRASLFLIDAPTGELWSKVAEGAEIREIRVPRGQGVSGWVAEHCELVNIPDAYHDDRFNPEVDKRTGYVTRSILCAPVWGLDNEMLGVVQVVNKRTGRFLSNDEVLIRAFAHQAAVAVENHNLYRRMVIGHRKMAVLLDIASSINDTLDIGLLIRKVVSGTREAIGCERGSFFVADEDSRELWSMEFHGSEVEEIRFPMGTGLAGHAASTGEVVNVPDAYADHRFNPDIDRRTGYRTRSVLCMPVTNREGRVTGVVQCINKGGGVFDDDDVQLLRAIGSQVSVALDNARLYARAVDMRNYLESVQQSISVALLSLDQAYRVITVNRAAEALIEGCVAGVDIRDLMGERNAEVRELIDAGYSSRTGLSREDLSFRRRGGDIGSANLNVVPLHDNEGEFVGLVLIIEDITDEKRVKNAFSHYLAPAVIDRLLEDPQRLSLGGEKREVTALFTDIQGFTTVSERVDPAHLVRLLNEYFDETCAIVLRYGATIDKIVGDSLHVLFNAPVDQPDHPERAVRCALELDRSCQALVTRQRAKGLALGLTRIGINTGLCVVGNFGGSERFDYTAHGDAVNTAARLESVNRHLGTRICVSGSTKARCRDLPFRPVGRLVLKGKHEPIEVYEPLSSVDSPASTADYCEAYERMERNDPSAARTFADLTERCPADGLAAFHAERLAAGETGVTILMAEK